MKSHYWALRLGAACCFIGHGAFGFITKAAWLPYFGVVGIPEAWAWSLMPLVGAVDVLAGMAILFRPARLPLIYDSTVERDASGTDWRSWFENAGTLPPEGRVGPRFSQADLMLQAAAQGLGVALARYSLVHDDLVAGRLVPVLTKGTHSDATKRTRTFSLRACRSSAG